MLFVHIVNWNFRPPQSSSLLSEYSIRYLIEYSNITAIDITSKEIDCQLADYSRVRLQLFP